MVVAFPVDFLSLILALQFLFDISKNTWGWSAYFDFLRPVVKDDLAVYGNSTKIRRG